MTARLQKIGKKKGNFWMFGWWVWFFTHWSGSAAFVEKDEADSCHRWPQYNALPGRFKGCYSFRYPNKVQLRFWLIQNFVWKPNSREIDVPPLCEMSFIQPVHVFTLAGEWTRILVALRVPWGYTLIPWGYRPEPWYPDKIAYFWAH